MKFPVFSLRVSVSRREPHFGIVYRKLNTEYRKH